MDSSPRKSLCPRKVLSTKKCLSPRKCLSTGNSQITSKFVDHEARLVSLGDVEGA